MITLEKICFSYHKKEILQHVDLQIDAGTCIGLVGVNGCGKSTLLSILAGIRRPDSGKYMIYKKDALRNKQLFSNIGYVPQENPLIPDLSVQDNLRLWYAATPYSLEQDLNAGLLSMLDLTAYLKYPIHKLSGGIKKRVSLAIAFSKHPNLLLLDEPSTALDIPCKKEIRQYLQNYKESSGTILLSTHDENDLKLCDHIYMLQDKHLKKITLETLQPSFYIN